MIVIAERMIRYDMYYIIMMSLFHINSVLVLLLLVFYVYAIIGMEIFSGPEDRVYPGCW